MHRLIVVGPLPPPVHGVTVSTSLVLANPILRERFRVEHLDTSDPRSTTANIGRWDVTNVRLALQQTAALARLLRGRRGVLYLPLSQSGAGFLRDSLFVALGALSGWRVCAHLRGSDFRSFYDAQGALSRAWIRSTLQRLSSIAVMGDSLRWLFDGLVPPERVVAVPNGTPDVARSIAHDGWPATVLFLSNLRRRKGVVQAVDAALQVAGTEPDTRFVFAGEWEDPELEIELHKRASAAQGRIRFLPPVNGRAKDELFGSSSIFLFPPVEPEGHPRVVLEAMSAGLPGRYDCARSDRGDGRERRNGLRARRSGSFAACRVPRATATRSCVAYQDGARLARAVSRPLYAGGRRSTARRLASVRRRGFACSNHRRGCARPC